MYIRVPSEGSEDDHMTGRNIQPHVNKHQLHSQSFVDVNINNI